MVKSIEWVDGKVKMLDQTRLPLEVVFIECKNYMEVAEGIKKLIIRGAPAIGIAAAMGVALAAPGIDAGDFKTFMKGLAPAMQSMIDTRPTAVNIKWAVDRLEKMLYNNRDRGIPELKELIVREANAILEEDIRTNRAIGKWGAEFLHDGDTVLTHCNAGALATGGYGTATAPILLAIEQGKKIQVIADETRPVLQGARLTAWELMQAGVPVTLITDNSAGALMKNGMIDLAIVGTDRTAANGDVANKIGTYSVAVLCREHSIPFYVAAPVSSIDFSIPGGDRIPIEERSGREVTHINGEYQIAPEGVNVINMAFDVTPSKYVTAIFTERGAFRPSDISKLEKEDSDIETLRLIP
ncbi:methylthioribose-1-phosphate isomerase [bacterium BMS3Abin07]|nr:methylthioribose-1-phosphate isomerase [bacterium BMS3Abin07]GBE33156.1 methylthioribose-1-phosphate isomerase [bacterium BMS3Bbin05]HDL21176.1 S-methyl-5-thioribose-1-phosphate isomerase [Nitrospirota bacterium]HDO22640.1 S-methyl-5-thioribose-1-phosphate isomerase [Nitrospirota bacterium]HDZ87644.1 S-methyl-5-thioribose-1-phosphate isomerase [Nitrospirota bacterium]